MKLKISLILVLGFLVGLSGCIEDRQDIGPEVKKATAVQQEQGERIENIMADRQAYNGKEVTVAGKVLPGLAFEFVGQQPYQIIQGESLLWVITSDMSPAEGAFVTVRGKIAVPYQIKGRSYEIVLVEEERR
jgi:hypothetical protein